jgi:hypothetical protein
MKKMILLALAAASVAMFALPAVASAGTWHIEPPGGVTTTTFTVSGGAGTLTSSGGNVSCLSTGGSGHYENTTTGTMTITFHGCTTEIFGSKVHCQTSGQPTGTITTTKLPIHNVILDVTAGGVKDPGILVTPAAGSFAHFNCSIASVTVEGNGLLGQLTKPACGASSNVATVEFTDIAGAQEWKQVTTTGTSYGLIRSGNPAVMQTNATITLPSSSKVNCT